MPIDQRLQQVLDLITDLCEVHEYSQFEVSVTTDADTVLFRIQDNVYTLNEMEITIEEIERLERHDQIAIVTLHRFKTLRKNEILRTTYSLFAPSKGPVIYSGRLNEDKWKPLSIIAFFGALLAFVMAVFMLKHNVNIVGYDTFYGGGYGYQTLSVSGVIVLGVFFLFVGLGTMPRKKRK